MPHSTFPAVPRLEALVTAWSTLLFEPGLDITVQRIADLARQVAQARYAAIGLLAPDRLNLARFVTSGLTEEETQRIGARPSGHGILGLVIREARPVRLTNLQTHPEAAGYPAHHPPMTSFLGVPIKGRHGVVGHLYLTEKLGGGAFTDEDEHLVVLLAGMAAAAMENAQHMEDSARLLSDVQELMRSRERFFAMVNHELRNSLAAVLGWSEMLVRRKDAATVPRAAFEVLESAEAAVALVSDLLDLSRLDEDRLKPVIQPVNVTSLVVRAVSRVTPAAAGRQVRVEIHETTSLPMSQTDPHRVEQILVNLLTNAVRHSPAGEAVRVTSSAENQRLVILVSDRGPGIPPEQLARIFDVYFTRVGPEGVGLGLALSRRLARLLGGDLQAANREEGGAELRLELPLGLS